jgi:DNA-binding Xre family transcriptional regulator
MSRSGAIKWRLRVLMAERGIVSIVGLRKALVEQGLELSAVQLGRMVKHIPQLLPTDVIVALCLALSCAPGDLMQLDESAAAIPRRSRRQGGRKRRDQVGTSTETAPASEANADAEATSKKRTLSEEEVRKLIGPKISALMPHPVTRRSS